MRRIRLAVVGAAAIAMITTVSGCSDSDGDSSASTPSTEASAKASAKASKVAQAAGDKATVKTASSDKLGTILVDEKGRTLYLFEKDKSTTSTCDGACAKAWPPLLTSGTPKTGGSAKSKLIDTSKRSDGKTQVTYDGHPLYRFQGDSKAGDTNGQGLNQFGAKWFVLDADGKEVEKGGAAGSGY
ncbi:hypothetical protein DMB38_10965 [Streptomyces sp. WAC 06738]|uniref:COG4315 family predicted lipoprotein n=1 Tax=Streptomyces sp. WAC 06738 TaxID=2203210 RepID=UPI000F704856|nr:hypothetical protein [Streptomyces sp. WAC 06738]AZM46268.1 hypothetical protein DMB38_10965 [Streptomyces sp. WAC 06738]